MLTIYDAKTGEPMKRDAIDAKQCVEVGLATWTNPANKDETIDNLIAQDEQAEISQKVADAANMTVNQLKEALSAAGIGFKPFDTKPILLESYMKYLKGE